MRRISLVLFVVMSIACRSRATGAVALAGGEVVDTAFTPEIQAAPLPGNMPPEYPDELRKKNVQGEVYVRFVVDTNGRVMPGSIRVLSSTDDLFTKSVRRALIPMRFSPAIHRGRKVRQVVVQPFNFWLQ
jgi:periplasmic protein TonB